MLWQGRELPTLSDDELREAIHSIVGIDKNRLDKLDNPRKRHIKIFEKHPPVENPAFAQLAKELNDEFKKRKLEYIVAKPIVKKSKKKKENTK